MSISAIHEIMYIKIVLRSSIYGVAMYACLSFQYFIHEMMDAISESYMIENFDSHILSLIDFWYTQSSTNHLRNQKF